jgi:hypothetical protein
VAEKVTIGEGHFDETEFMDTDEAPKHIKGMLMATGTSARREWDLLFLLDRSIESSVSCPRCHETLADTAGQVRCDNCGDFGCIVECASCHGRTCVTDNPRDRCTCVVLNKAIPGGLQKDATNIFVSSSPLIKSFQCVACVRKVEIGNEDVRPHMPLLLLL